MIYAQLNENNVCIGISQLSGKIEDSKVVEIATADFEYYIWRKYENGEWSTEKFEPETTSPLTEFEKLKKKNEELEGAVMELTAIIATMQGGSI
ncbi:hypothetical protein KQI86_19330 [Clostridium sp. MSJ-11]|uniref:Uncharacterized protein n=1 Tax=Clostridium mobile TaxID=2841512 RepID=A0ABS6ENW0_9CLOT|nr:hypothetical protein [Clostridium mobile]MBU5486457.1 hypothetical protein [Clostridium mobile]